MLLQESIPVAASPAVLNQDSQTETLQSEQPSGVAVLHRINPCEFEYQLQDLRVPEADEIQIIAYNCSSQQEADQKVRAFLNAVQTLGCRLI